MKLSRKDWNNYVARLSAINRTAGRKMQAWIDQNGIDDVQKLVEVAYVLTTKYGEASSAAVCQMYDEIAEIQKANVPPAEPKPPQNIKYVDKAIRRTLDRAPSTVPSTVSEMVKRTGAETTLKNAQRDGAYFAWIPNGDTCPFCITIASNGWRRASKKTAGGDYATHIHPNCDCEFAISLNGPGDIEGYDPDKYLAMYEGAEGDNWQDKVNSMRRANYAANKDAINAQKRAAYKVRKAREIVANDGGDGIIKQENTIDFYVGPNRKVIEAKYASWIGDSKRNEYLAIGQDPHYINAIDKLFRPGSFIGDGGTGAVLRFEKQTGLYLGKNGPHLIKAEEMVRYIRNKVMPRSLSSEERRVLTIVLADLENAIKEFKS